MTDQDDSSNWKSSTRGEQAWKETLDRVSSRNAEARKVGKVEREAYERGRQIVRQTAAAKSHADLVNRPRP
ncbi:MAG: hypothetical protein ACXWEE_04200 [Thermoleophilaceae bacterium]|jgi:hypothetical protein